MFSKCNKKIDWKLFHQWSQKHRPGGTGHIPTAQCDIETGLYLGLYRVIMMTIAQWPAVTEWGLRPTGTVHFSGTVGCYGGTWPRRSGLFSRAVMYFFVYLSWSFYLFENILNFWHMFTPTKLRVLCRATYKSSPNLISPCVNHSRPCIRNPLWRI